MSVPDPTADLAAYEQALVTLAEREDIGTILPFREADIYALAKHRDTLTEHVGTPWPSLDTLRAIQDRIELREVAAAAGVSMPQTTTVPEWEQWDKPSIVKPRYTVHAPAYAEEFDTASPEEGSTQYVPAGSEPDHEQLYSEMGHMPLVQEFVPDTDEYAFFALYEEGEPVATFQHRQRRGWKYTGGPSAYRESVEIPELESAGRALLDELDYHGVAMVEFLRNPETGSFELMEINPRFWSSLPFTVQAGVDFPALYWEQATGETVCADPEYEVGIAGHLLWGELLHLHSVVAEEYPLVERPSLLRTACEVASSIVREPRFDYLSTDDPEPFVQDLRNKIAGTVGNPLERIKSTRQQFPQQTEKEPATQRTENIT